MASRRQGKRGATEGAGKPSGDSPSAASNLEGGALAETKSGQPPVARASSEPGPQAPSALDSIAAAEQDIAARIDAAADEAAIAGLKLETLGKRGPLQALYAGLRGAEPEARRALGAGLQGARERLTARLVAARSRAEAGSIERERRAGQSDLSLPGRLVAAGAPHPLRLVEERVLAILQPLGFVPVEGPLIEHDWFNFEALNLAPGHPAREMQDTFFVRPDVVLRTHTSNLQIRAMLACEPPFAIVAPGMVFRRDEVDASHTPVFHQIEGLWLGNAVSFADLKGVLEALLGQLFGANAAIRFRPSYFPFTEPSTEVDVACSACVGRLGQSDATCRLCRGTGWLEILGAGMVDEAVLTAVGLEGSGVRGFAFGLGIERLAMLLYGIDDIRMLYDQDLRFSAQFAADPGSQVQLHPDSLTLGRRQGDPS